MYPGEGERAVTNLVCCVRDLRQEYFFGELIPPYIDKLGRGAHLRPTDSDNTLYQSGAKCYRNLQALGSKASIS